MKRGFHGGKRERSRMKTLCFLLLFFLLSAGCTQPSAPVPAPASPAEATTGIPVALQSIEAIVQRIDTTKLLVTYIGGPDADQLIELETTVVSGTGTVTIQSMGSRLDTTPVQRGGTDIIRGSFSGRVHVLITGYFFNGTHQDILETWV
jgi:hypothetical protein